VIVSLGLPAAQALLGTKKPMHQLRGTWMAYKGIPVMPTYHPAYVLRNYTVTIRRQVWGDVLQVVEFLGRNKRGS
jgi:DNA polymerase